MLVPKPLILFIDAYDSFSNNIVSLLETTLNVSVRIIKIDDPSFPTDAALHEELSHYAAVVCGPGPGHPGNKEDVGLIQRIWKLDDEHMLPVLGICLGFQSLCLEYGAEVKRLKGPQHGIIRKVNHIGSQKGGENTIFRGVGDLRATLYQSLCADTGHNSSSEGWAKEKWEPSDNCPDLIPLAWAEHNLTVENNSGIMDESVLVAVQHRRKPFWALQYHPESICTNEESIEVIRNFFSCALTWLRQRCQDIPRTKTEYTGPVQGRFAKRPSLLSISKQKETQAEAICMRKIDMLLDDIEFRSERIFVGPVTRASKTRVCHCKTINLPENLSVTDIYEAVRGSGKDEIILESSNANQNCVGTADVRGTHSIIAMDLDMGKRIEYSTKTEYVKILQPNSIAGADKICKYEAPITSSGGIWPFLAKIMDNNHVDIGNGKSPFWGGFMGYMTYEMGLEGIDVTRRNGRSAGHSRPDLCFAWVNRSLVTDHRERVVHIQALAGEYFAPEIEQWMQLVAKKIENASVAKSKTCSGNLGTSELELNLAYFRESVKNIKTPSNDEYEAKVRRCQSYIRSGDSYELCLTAQTTITRYKDIPPPYTSDNPTSSWTLYKTLRTRQPAPFASYLRLGPTALISSSPERFLTHDSTGNCELRPMKGTVKKTPTCNTLAQATALLNVPKEKAENLMIVDLVRHDLHGVCGAGNVAVPRLMVVEEYASVFQMISVVQGQIPPAVEVGMESVMCQQEVEKARSEKYTGIDALAASLPPGSMTGAPKKRSCEILGEIEGQERGLYSGVVGYLDVAGRGDWSVTIRSLFKWDGEDEVDEDGEQLETWRVGAGGAVTALSSPVGEREEMQTKLGGTLGIFR